MANGEKENERQHLSLYVKSQTKYGTASAKYSGNVPLAEKPTKHIKHNVDTGDTLMGIALKYQVTVEQIKRLNKLWTNDSLFLREHILIPLLPTNQDFVPKELIVEVSDRFHSSNEETSKDTNSPATSNPINGMDFLSKYDTDIEQLKSNLKKIEKKSGNNANSSYTPTVRHNLGPRYELPFDRDTEC